MIWMGSPPRNCYRGHPSKNIETYCDSPSGLLRSVVSKSRVKLAPKTLRGPGCLATCRRPYLPKNARNMLPQVPLGAREEVVWAVASTFSQASVLCRHAHHTSKSLLPSSALHPLALETPIISARHSRKTFNESASDMLRPRVLTPKARKPLLISTDTSLSGAVRATRRRSAAARGPEAQGTE